jgi:signal transduction histidine kinase
VALGRWRTPSPWLVAVGGIGAVATLAPPTPYGVTAAGLILSAAAVAAATFPVATGAIAWSVCAVSVVTGMGIDLPTYLLVGVPLWAVNRYSPAPGVAAGACSVFLGGLLTAVSAAGNQLQIYILAPVPWPSGWTLIPNSWVQSLALALAVWLAGALFAITGLIGRWRESSRTAASTGQASRARTEELTALNALAEERTRISREMHDIVAHSLSVMIAQADGGRYAAATNPQAAIGALEAIARTGRDALGDMRGIVRVLRDGPEDQGVELRPAPHVRDLEVLVAETRQAGLGVTLVRVGEPRYLPPGVGAALQRIAQEALTNVMKHAGPGAAATVTERWLADRIELAVADDGRGASAVGDGEGHGLIGMRERAEMLGGTLRAGPGPTGGFLVTARLPLPRTHQEGETR